MRTGRVRARIVVGSEHGSPHRVRERRSELRLFTASIDRSLAPRSGGLAATEAEVMMMLDESSPSHLVSDTRSEIQGERPPSLSPAIAGLNIAA